MANDLATLQKLAEERLAEAKLLLASGYPSGAYYLAGYAVELALKVPIATKFVASEIPDKSFVNAIYTHDLTKLLSLAGLKADLDASMEEQPELKEHWEIIKEWSEQARYDVWTREAAEMMLDAIEGEEGGLLPWL